MTFSIVIILIEIDLGRSTTKKTCKVVSGYGSCSMSTECSYIETQLETETMKAVPMPRFEVGENTLAAQLLSETR